MDRFQRRRQAARHDGKCCVCHVQRPPLGRSVCGSCNEKAKLRVRKSRERSKALLAIDRPFDPDGVSQIAGRLAAADIVAEAIAYYEAAGDIAVADDQFEEAATHFRRAVALEGQRNQTRSQLIRKLARTLQRAGAQDEAADLAQQLVEVGGATASDEVARDLGFLGMVSWEGAKTEVAYQYISRAANLTGDVAVRFENLANAAWLSYELGNMAKATELLERATKLKAKVPVEIQARFLDVRGRTRLSDGRVEQGFEDFRSAVELAERADGRDLYFALAGNYADNAELIGDFEGALRIWKRLRARAKIGHMGWRGADATLNAARCCIALGDLIEAERLVDDALAETPTCAVVRIHAAVAGITIGIYRHRQDLIDRCADESVIGLALRSKEAVKIGPAVAAFSLLAISQNRLEDAKNLLDMGVAALRTADHAFWMLSLATEYSNMDAARTAQRLLNAASELRHDHLSTAFTCYLDALVAKREGRRTAAQSRASAAGILFGRLGMKQWQAKSVEIQGSPKKALGIYESMGNLYDRVRLQTGFARRRARSGRASELTPRLEQVGRLIADGMSNKQVARELGISEKTVNNHLQTIYARLGLTSRAKLIAHFIKGL